MDLGEISPNCSLIPETFFVVSAYEEILNQVQDDRTSSGLMYRKSVKNNFTSYLGLSKK